jgi:hypothetical protein
MVIHKLSRPETIPRMRRFMTMSMVETNTMAMVVIDMMTGGKMTRMTCGDPQILSIASTSLEKRHNPQLATGMANLLPNKTWIIEYIKFWSRPILLLDTLTRVRRLLA